MKKLGNQDRRVMKRILCFVIIIMAMLTCGITLLLPKVQEVQADISGTDGAQFILTGYSGNNPKSYFTNSKNESTLVNAQEVSPDKDYINKNGQQTKAFYYITGKHTSKDMAKSSGICEIYPSVEMKKIISEGQMVVKASCGLLALDSQERSKVNITVQIIAGGQVSKTLTLTSDKVSSNNNVFEPDWVETELVELPKNTEKIIYSFESRQTANRKNAAKFYMFEPSVYFATNLTECKISNNNQSIKSGQVVKLLASNLITSETSTSPYFEYYKEIHKIGFEIVEGGSFAKIVGSYLYVDSDIPFGSKIVVRAKCRKSTLSPEYIYSKTRTFTYDIESVPIKAETDFENPAKITGEGDYFVGDHATLSVVANSGFEFVGWERAGEIVSTSTAYTFKVEKNQSIKAKFIKTVSIKQIFVKTKFYNGTTDVQFEKIDIEGVEGSHDVKVEIAGKFATNNVGESKKVEFVSVPTLVGENASIYKLTNFVPETTGTIAQQPLKIRAKKLSKVYGDNDPILTFEASGLIEGEFALGTLSREKGEDVGEYQINSGNMSDKNPNYEIEFEGAVFEIEKREIVLTNIGVVSKTYDKNCNAQIYATTQNIISGDDVSLEFEASFEDENVGTNKIVNLTKTTILGDDSNNYFVSDAKTSLLGTIIKKQICVSSKEQTFCYGDEIDIKYSAEGLLDGDELVGRLEISSNQVGSYVVSLGTLSNNNYEIALVSDYVHIEAKKIVVVANSASKNYGDSDPKLSFSVQGLVEGDTLEGEISREAGEGVGVYSIVVGTLQNDNYEIEFRPANFEILKRPIQVEFSFSDKIYDGTTDVIFVYSITNALEKDDVKLDVELAFEDPNAAEEKKITVRKIEIVGDNKEKYLLNYDQNLFFASISAKNVNISANSVQKTYGDGDPDLVLEFEGVVGEEKIAGLLTREKGENVGTYSYQIPDSMKRQNPNYSLCLTEDVALTIVAKDVDIKIKSKQKQFGDADPEIEYVLDSNSFVFGDTFENLFTGSSKREKGEEVGRFFYEKGSMSLGKNYNVNFISDGVLTINKRDITVSANNLSKTYGDLDPEFSLTQENIVPGVFSTIRLKREKGENVGKYKITYDSLDDPHYNVTFVSGELEILPYQITVKVEDTFKHYGEPDPNFEFVIIQGSLKFDDDLSTILKGAVSRVAGENVGEYQINQGTLGAGSNYEMSFVCGTLSIYVQELVLRLCDVTKYYGDPDPTFAYEVVSGDIGEEVLTGKAKRRAGERVGSYMIDIGTLSTSLNYKFRYSCGTLTILPRPIEITALPAEKTYGEGDPEFVYEVTKGSLVEQNDLSGKLYRENVGVKIYESVGKYPILSSLNNPNYDITYICSQLSIKQREIVVSSRDYSSVYGEDVLTTFDYLLEGEIMPGDSLTGGLYKTEGVEAGEYPIRCNISLGRNYKIIYNQAHYNILPRTLVVSLGANEKIYSNPDPIFSLQILEGELVGDETLEWEVQREDCENVGDYVLEAKSLDENYALVTRNSILQILKKDVKLNLDLLDKPYDATDVCKIKNPIVSGLVDNEIVLEYDKNNCAKFSSILPGNNIEVRLLDFWLVGSKAGNYNLILPTGLYANITHSSLESQNVEISTFNSTSMKFGTTLNVKNVEIGDDYNGKKVLRSLNVGLLDEGGNSVVVDNALNMKIEVQNLSNYNNIRVYGKNAAGKYVELKHKIEGDNLVVSTSTFSDFVVVCDNEIWIDIALAVCVGMFLGIGLCVLIIDLKKKQNKK